MKSEVVVPRKSKVLTDDASQFTNTTADKVPRPLKPESLAQAKILAKAVSAAPGSGQGRGSKQLVTASRDS